MQTCFGTLFARGTALLLVAGVLMLGCVLSSFDVVAETEERREVSDAEPRTEVLDPEPRDEALDPEPRKEVLDAEPVDTTPEEGTERLEVP